ncbi:MAG TPA: ATP-binding protein [Chloroflexota bacterium]|nr:ATP-binding protein [Chloroflexota bacterium]
MTEVLGYLRRSLTAKILVAFAAVVLIGIGGVAILANASTTAEFESFLSAGQPAFNQRLANLAGTTYQETGSWNAVSQALAALGRLDRRRVLVVNPAGVIVVDTAGTLVGRPATSLPLEGGIPVQVKGEIVGTLYPVPLALPGRNLPDRERPSPFFGVPRPFGGSPDVILSRAESAFLARVDQSLLIAAVVATVLALLVGGFLARRIIHPLRRLTEGARRIAEGHFDERIPVTGEDEVGQLAHAFNQMAESLQRTELARRQLVADVAHELRTPLTVIGGTVQAMRDGILAVDDQNLAAIDEEVVALTRLVSDLRDLSLGDVGQLPLQRGPVDLKRLIETVAASFATQASARGLSLSVEGTASLPILNGDEARLRQCIANLLTNALRHTPAGGQITIRARAQTDLVEIQVVDTGEGIAPEHLPRVFERFYRADPSRARRSGGTGLGLAIVQQIVRAHDGEIFATSKGLGHGATFTIRLPVAVSAKPASVLTRVSS